MPSDTPSAFKPSHYLAVRFWPTWILFGLLWLGSRLPLSTQLWLGRRLGDTMYFLIKKRRRITAVNLKLCFPEKSTSERQQLTRDAFQAVGMSVFEMASLWFRKPDFLLRRCEFEGLENLQALQKSGTGIILLQAHFTTLELGANLIGTRITMDGNYDPPKNALYAAFLLNRREQYVLNMIDNHDIRQMVRRLREGRCVWYSPDQHVPVSSGGVETTFFNQPVSTTTGTSRMAKIAQAVVIPYLSVRDHSRCRYHLKILPPLKAFPGESPLSDTQKINDVFEAHIRDYPGQYFWVHRRFKPISDKHHNHYRN